MADTTQAAFIAAIRANPEDDLPRLVYADWLEENGDAARAEFIRVQCRLSQIEAVLAKPYGDQALCTEVAANWCPVCGECCCPESEAGEGDPSCPLHSPMSRHAGDDSVRAVLGRLRRRVWELTIARHKEWFVLAGHLPSQWTGQYTGWDVELSYWAPGGKHPTSGSATVRRGFVSEVRCRLTDWCGGLCDLCERCGRRMGFGTMTSPQCPHCHGPGRPLGIGPAVAAAHLCERVEVTDREPRVWRNGAEWFANYEQDLSELPLTDTALVPSNWLPWCVAKHLGPSLPPRDSGRFVRHEWNFPTPDAALDALSAALIAWAKSAAPA